LTMIENLGRCISYLFIGLIAIPIAIIVKKAKKNLTFGQALWRSFVGVFGVLLLIGGLIMLFEQSDVENIKTTESNSRENTPSKNEKTQNPQITKPTSTKKPTATKITKPTAEQCKSASSITINQKGQSIEICGKVTYVGKESCPNCPNGGYSYLILDDNFYILSYDWFFYPEWVGDCIMVKDKVEQFGSKPAFVFGKSEGYDGSECEILPNGTKSCGGGDYFQSYSGCR